MTPLEHNLVTTVLGIGAAGVVLRQCRKPSWLVGRLFLRSMNARHSGVTNWGLSHVPIQTRSTILDVGCGGGRTIATLAGMAAEGHVCGIDYSPESVATSRSTNAALISEGRVDVREGSVSSLPFPADTFDVVTAVETHYYWPDLAENLKEILRVLKPGGRLAIVAETYKGRKSDWLYRPAMMLLRATYLNVQEHRDLLSAAGFLDVEVFEERAHGWMCAVGRK